MKKNNELDNLLIELESNKQKLSEIGQSLFNLYNRLDVESQANHNNQIFIINSNRLLEIMQNIYEIGKGNDTFDFNLSL